MTTQEIASKRVEYFKRMYDVFYSYFVKKLSQDDGAYTKFDLQRQANVFSDLDLYTVVTPVFQSGASTADEKKAVARAALYDALVAHTFGKFFETTGSEVGKSLDVLSKRVGELERRLNKLAQVNKNTSETPSAQV